MSEDVVNYDVVYRNLPDIVLAIEESYCCLYSKIENDLRVDFKECGKCKMKDLCKTLYEIFIEGYEVGYVEGKERGGE